MKKHLLAVLFFLSFTSFSCKKQADIVPDNQSSNINTSAEPKVNVKTTDFGSNSFLWMYEFDTKSDNATLIQNLGTMKMSNVYVSVNPELLYPSGKLKSQNFTASFISFLDKAKAANVKVHVMLLETNTYLFTQNHEIALSKVKSFIDFCNASSAYLLNPICGIHIDVEPHALPEWQNTNSWETKDLLVKQYVTLLQKVYTLMKSSTLPIKSTLAKLDVSAAIAAFYDVKAKQNLLPSGSSENLKKYLDVLVPMAYLEPAAAGTLSTAQKIELIKINISGEMAASSTVIGLNADDYDSFSNIKDVYCQLNDYYKTSPNYKGICFFRYASMLEFYKAGK